MSSNFPPGCNSPDGGIDHAFEDAIEKLCQEVENAEEIRLLLMFLPAVREISNSAYRQGVGEGRMEQEV